MSLTSNLSVPALSESDFVPSDVLETKLDALTLTAKEVKIKLLIMNYSQKMLLRSLVRRHHQLSRKSWQRSTAILLKMSKKTQRSRFPPLIHSLNSLKSSKLVRMKNWLPNLPRWSSNYPLGSLLIRSEIWLLQLSHRMRREAKRSLKVWAVFFQQCLPHKRYPRLNSRDLRLWLSP